MDNFKIIYKILKVLESALDDEQFDLNKISHNELNVGITRWTHLMQMLYEDGLISGISVVYPLSKYIPQIRLSDVHVTLKGLEYLETNFIMKKLAKPKKRFFNIVK